MINERQTKDIHKLDLMVYFIALFTLNFFSNTVFPLISGKRWKRKAKNKKRKTNKDRKEQGE